MTDVVSTCRSTWKRLGVPAQARADLEFELRTNLDAAAFDGLDATTFVGGDPDGLAREWAVARGLVRSRWLVAGSLLTALVVGYASLTFFVLMFIGRGYSVASPPDSPALWLPLLADDATWLLLPVLVAVGLYLRFAHDTLATRTVVLVLVTSPVTLWLSELTAFALQGPGGAPARSFWVSVVFALLLATIRAAIVAADRRPTHR
ncbi:hypothetical protein [Pengzhenrongella phosphoraccumulans]|uniref:hypothetical protein n=1 Tax=Pengzhenrongella phosphoraccumulans TaxID=3114394 RepID=UPI003890DFE6